MDNTRDEILFGYHFDLKPTNILVDDDGLFIISDFGQAHFAKASDATSSRVVGMGGTESNAPPEIDEPVTYLNRKHDIWSMGCIILEASAFVVQASTGVHNLDNSRIITSKNRQRTDDRFFYRDDSGVSRIKPSILKWMDQLVDTVKNIHARHFIQKIFILVLRILEVDVSQRLTSKELCVDLSEILCNSQSTSDPQTLTSYSSDHPGNNCLEVGRNAMSLIPTMNYNVERY